MATYGVKFQNDAGQVVISDAMKNMHYIGNAVNTSNGITCGEFGGQYARFRNVMRSFFQIQSATQPICFIAGSAGSYYTIASMSQSGNTWTFEVFSYPTAIPTLLCFATIPQGVGLLNPTGSVVAVFDEVGNVIFDADRKVLDPAFFGLINMPSCGPNVPGQDGYGLCTASNSNALGISVQQPAFFFSSRARAQVGSFDYSFSFTHCLNLNSNGSVATCIWNSFLELNRFTGYVNRTLTREYNVGPTMLIVIDAARYL